MHWEPPHSRTGAGCATVSRSAAAPGSDAAWQAFCQALEAAHCGLRDAVRPLEEPRLDEARPGSDTTLRGLLLGTLQHNAYHAGQIGVVRKLSEAALGLEPDGRFSIANAGHPRPLVADDRGVRPLEGGGLPLGLFGDSVYTEWELALGPGQTLLLYTDGWTEGAREDHEFGIGRAAASLRRGAGLPLPDLLRACRADLDQYLAGSPSGDDLTLVAVRRAA